MENEILEENKRLKERVQYLENILNRGNSSNSEAYSIIRGMIINKVKNELKIPEKQQWRKDSYIKQIERRVMKDLLWEIHVRRVAELRTEHIESAEKYIKNYVLPE